MSDVMNFIDDLISRDSGERDYRPVYVREGDCVVYYADATPCHAVRINDVATVYVSDEDSNRLVGCQIKDVMKRMRRYGAYGVEISRGGTAKLGLLFMMAGVIPDRSLLIRALFQSELPQRNVDLPELAEA